MERSEIELGLQGKMIELGPHFEPLQFDEATQGGKEMSGLGGDGLRGGLGQRDLLFERLVITLDVAVATHKTIDLVVHTQVYKLKRNMRK